MNLALIDPFVLAKDYPENLTGELSSGHACTLKFNHRGDYFASGRTDGTIVVFDVETFGPARKLRGHSKIISSLSWSRDSRYLLSAAQDCKCILWDMRDGSRVRTVRLEAPIWFAEMHPENPFLITASLFDADPVLVDISRPNPVVRSLSSAPLWTDGADGTTSKKKKAAPVKQSVIPIIFSSVGRHIITGTNKGWINIIETETCRTIYSTCIERKTIILLLRLSSNGRDLLANCNDKSIRTMVLPDLSRLPPATEADFETGHPDIHIEVDHKFSNVMNDFGWRYVAFSSTAEFVIASADGKGDMYIWERSRGSLVKILEGPKDRLGPLDWHPHRPTVIVCGHETGHIYVWSVATPQKWAALAPDFAEVEENVPYEEKEDEFDIHPAEEVHQRRLDLEDEVPDVLTVDRVRGVGGEEDDGCGFRMPILLDISDSDSEDDVYAIGPGQIRKRSPGTDFDREGHAQSSTRSSRR